jgi:ATP-dependent helicase/nuclease subunit A
MSIHQSKGLEFPVVIVPDVAAGGRGGVQPVARWHRGLGCLVKLPAEFEDVDEESGEKPPFADFADRLGRTADQLADWQEDLRVLYVACTRARDLLILSAGLPGPPAEAVAGLPAGVPAKAANHWTLALAERFDLRSGRCAAEDVSPADAPAVRVRVVEPGLEATPGTVAVNELSDPTPPHGRGGALSLAPRSPSIVSLAALERLARGEMGASFAEHFDTEADSDRPHWRHPRERLGPLPPADAVLWGVLDRWAFADVDGWAQLLADALEDAPDGQRLADELRAKLRRFAESEARAELAGAAELHRGVEFLADLAALAGETGGPAVRGVIDFLYRDPDGWHVLGVDPGVAEEDDPWRGRRPGLVVQAWAARQQLGEWPAAVGLFDLATGQWVRADPQRVRPAAVAAHFRRVLEAGRGGR